MGYIGQAPANKAITSADIEDGVVSAADLGANSVDSSELVNGSVDIAHLSASGTASSSNFLRGDNAWTAVSGFDVSTITGATALGATPADTDEFILSDAGVLKRVDYSYLKATNSPSFAATLSANQSFTASTWTKITCDTEISDTDGCYDNTTNYRFTPTTAGRYYVWSLFWQGAYNTYMYGTIRKNGSMIFNSTADGSQSGGQNTNGVVDMNGSSDYVEFWSYVGTNANTFRTSTTLWGAFRIIE